MSLRQKYQRQEERAPIRKIDDIYNVCLAPHPVCHGNWLLPPPPASHGTSSPPASNCWTPNKPTAAVTALSWQEDQLRCVDVSVQVAARQTGSGKPRQWMSRKTEHGGKSSIIVSETTSKSLLCIVSARLCRLRLYHLKGSILTWQRRKQPAEIWGEEQWVNIKSETRHRLQNQRLLMASIPSNNNIGPHLEQATFILALLILFP